ncbi:hypothetical protein DPMN_093979 [Dreissena polymorpha]|uniref:Uncharacterized protein n=1 Tax=Dreissena polymorpha TaxID=45954 RepID=A0A9D4L3Y1_DREPO|nr:hypothetical protein DPMN_093979 [Dreissena polymorpha]
MWHSHIEVHDSYLIKDHKPGTMRSVLLTIRNFLKWCKDTRQASEHALDEADRMLAGCLTATCQEVQQREVKMRMLESTTLSLDPVLARTSARASGW